jgi:hypothetical protein
VFPKEAAGNIDHGLPVFLSLNATHSHHRPPYLACASNLYPI